MSSASGFGDPADPAQSDHFAEGDRAREEDPGGPARVSRFGVRDNHDLLACKFAEEVGRL